MPNVPLEERYPWDEWFEKIKPKRNQRRVNLLLVRGEDYDCLTHSMMVSIRNAAFKRGLRVGCYVLRDGEAIEVVYKSKIKPKSKKRSKNNARTK